MTARPDAVVAAAEAWFAQDPDEETRTELRRLIEAVNDGDESALEDLHSRFDTRLAFGTAGLRGEIAAGPNRMNRVLVAQAAAGLAAYLLAHARGEETSIVIGYDGRRNSAVFARDTAELMAGAGVRAVLLPRLLPTPVLAFAVRHLGVSAGVMVTASHNPPNDNGYKVYLGGVDHGSQIVPPADAEIAACILEAAASSITALPRSEGYEIAPESVVDAYVAATASVAAAPAPVAAGESGSKVSGVPGSGVSGRSSSLTVAYTAMHGVGWETASRVFRAAGFPAPAAVAEQIEPDPAFPTVTFPNPEEPGAMDLSYATARAVGAELVIANDPDADRLAVAIPDSDAPEGYRRLSGNEVGALLGWRAAERAASAAEPDATPFGTLACSIVSSPALKAVADAYGLDFAETLTGFKWVSRVPGIIYGFEEALGYLVNPESVRDKDGISAAVAFLDLANALKADGISIADQLDRFAERFGYFSSAQISLRVTDLADIETIMTRLRENPPREIAGAAVTEIDDLIDGFGALPPSDVLRIALDDGSRVMVRPSGTEPKLKVYIDASSDQGTVSDRKQSADARVRSVGEAVNALLAG